MRNNWQSLSVKCSRQILLAILLSSLIVTLLSYFWVRDNAIAEQQRHLDSLLKTMMNTVRTACFANNSTLGQEVVDGLKHNKLVISAAIWSDGKLLAPSKLEPLLLTKNKSVRVLTQTVYSPFDDKEIIGQIAIYLDRNMINQEAHRSTRFVIMLLALQALLVIISVRAAVFRLIVYPIERIVRDLKKLSPFQGDMIKPLKHHQQDELGLLIDTINQLNRRLSESYNEEVNLRITYLTESEKRFRTIFEYAQTGLFTMDNQGRILSHNACFSTYLGLNALPNTIFDTRLSKYSERLHEMITSPNDKSEYFELKDNTGKTHWLELNIKRINEQNLQGILNDVTLLKTQEQVQRDIALTDALTGIHNRRSFDAYLQSLFNQNSNTFALMLVDLDWFKQVNDNYGHAAGDVVLCHTAEILKSSVRLNDYVSRLGGDEFAVIIEPCEHIELPYSVAERIIQHLTKPIAINDTQHVTIGCSIGIALYNTECETADQLFDYADKALYQAKESGRNCFRFFL